MPGILKIEFLDQFESWDILVSKPILCEEFLQVIRLAELISIKTFRKNLSQEEFRNNILHTLINFNGEQFVKDNEKKEIFVRQVPRYKNPYLLSLNSSLDYTFRDENFGKPFFFGNPLECCDFNSLLHEKMLKMLRLESKSETFMPWFKDRVLPLLTQDFTCNKSPFKASLSPDETGLCDVTLPSGQSYSFVLIPNCQNQLYRIVLSIHQGKYPSLRCLPDIIFKDFFILSNIWSQTVWDITKQDFVYKIVILMNSAPQYQQQVHIHLIRSYQLPNGTWERFAREPYVHNTKGNHEYLSAYQVALSKGQSLKTFVKNFQTKLIENLQHHSIKIDWPSKKI